MKGKKLKLWQMIVLIFSTVTLATGGSLLYVYLSGGFDNKKIEPENVLFVDNYNLYNPDRWQLEVENDFKLLLNSDTEGVTEKKVTLSFGKTLSTQTISNSEFVDIDGVKYISNGVIRVPEVVELGKEFTVNIEQKTYSYGSLSYQGNVGGISTLVAKGTKAMGEVSSSINIAVDVAVEKVDLLVKDTFTQESKKIEGDNVVILQNTNFEINPVFYPAQSKNRYSDDLYNAFYGQSVTPREKSYCFESSDKNVVMNYSEESITFTSNYNISSGNEIKFYIFKNASAEEAFLKLDENKNLQGQTLYNAMLKFLSAPGQTSVVSHLVDFSVEQAKVHSVRVNKKDFSMYVNQKYRLFANNNNYESNSLKLAISDEKGEDLKQMTKEVALQMFYTKAGGVKTEVVDDSVIKIDGGKTKVVYGQTEDITLVAGKAYYEFKDEQYVLVVEPKVEDIANYFEKHVYYFINSNVFNVNDAYWDISTSFEDSLVVTANFVLFETKKNEEGKYEEKIFDQENQDQRILTFNISEHAEENVAWLGEKVMNKTIVYNGGVQIPAEADLTTKISIPTNNVYQTAFYYVYKEGITANDVNINTEKTYEYNGDTYFQANSSDILFKTAGEYTVIFATVKTDAYGNLILKDEKPQIVKTSGVLTINISETLQEFASEISIDRQQYGVYELTKDTTRVDGKYYYAYVEEEKAYNVVDSGINPNASGLYELKYYAVKTTTGKVTLKIQVKEKDTLKFAAALENGKSENTDTTKDSLKFYVVSADGTSRFRVDPTIVKQEGTKCEVSLAMPIDQIKNDSGRGKPFYVQIVHNNTLLDLVYDVEVEDHYESAGLYNCFRLYTPTPETILNENLFGKTFMIDVSMDNAGQYTGITIKYTKEDGEIVTLTKEEFDNRYTTDVVVKDAYGRAYEDVKTVGILGASDSVGIADGKIQFASTKDGERENVSISISAGLNAIGEECGDTFNLDIKSYGLASVIVHGETYTGSTMYTTTYDINGASGNPITFTDIISAMVGNPEKKLDATYFYIKAGNDTDLLSMIKIGDEYAKEISTETPISSFKIAHDFYVGGKFTIVVTNSDRSAVEPADETVYFEVTFNILPSFVSTENLTEVKLKEAGLLSDDDKIIDGLYAGYSYSLDNLIKLERTNTNSELKWKDSAYTDDELVIYDTNGEKVAELTDAKTTITFYDVESIKENVTLQLSYYKGNKYSYTKTLSFNIYPNIEITTEKVVNLLTISDEAGVTNYLGIKRLRGTRSVADFKTKVEDAAFNLQIVGNNFVLNKAINFAYNQYSGETVVGLYLTKETDAGKEDFKVVNQDSTHKTTNVKYTVDFIQETLSNMFVVDGNVLPPEVKFITVNADGKSIKAVTVLSETANRTYIPDTNSKEYKNDKGTYKFSFDVQPASNVYFDRDGGIQFRSGTTGYRFGENIYINSKINKVIGDGATQIASVRIPVYVSNVGMHFANYENYNSELRNDFDINTLLNGDQNGLPQANMTAGESIRLTYKQDADGLTQRYASIYMINVGGISKGEFANGEYYTADINGVYNFTKATAYDSSKTYYKKASEGIYYDKEATVTVRFSNDSLSSEDGVIYEKNGEWYVKLNNLANNSKNIVLNVTLNQSKYSVNYTYRIKIQPNLKTEVTYPFAESVGGAEFIDISGDDEYDLNTVFGSYAGAKQNDHRFNIYLDEDKESTLSQDTEYYVLKSAFDEDIVSQGATLYTLSGETLVDSGITLPKYVKVEKSEEVKIDGESYVKVAITSSSYSVVSIKVKSNNDKDSQVIAFDSLTEDKEYTYQVMDGVVYKITAITNSNEGYREYRIYDNSNLIGKIKLYSSGRLVFEDINNEYFIGLALKKSYTNILGADLIYNMNINNTQGTYYVEYDATDWNTKLEVKTEVEGDFASVITMAVKFSGGDITSRDITADDNISFDTEKINYILKDRHGNIVKSTGIVNSVTLTKDPPGSEFVSRYELNTSIADLIDQDYKLIVYFASNSQTISTLTLNIHRSLKVYNNVENAFIQGGTTIDSASIKNIFDFKINDISKDISNFEILNIKDVDFISDTYKVADLNENKTAVLNFSFTVDGKEYFVDGLTVNFAKNITPVQTLSQITDYTAGETKEINANDLYQLSNGVSLQEGSELKLERIELTDGNANYFDFAAFSLSLNRTELEFKSLNVAQRVEAQFRAVITYSFGEYSFSWTTVVPVEILPNAEITTNYPKPENDKDQIDSESIVEGIYNNFFTSQAYLADEDSTRVAISSTIGKDVLNENAIIRIKNLQNLNVYHYDKVDVEVQADAGKYYIAEIDDAGKVTGYKLAFPYDENEKYYVPNRDGVTYSEVTYKSQQAMGTYYVNIGTEEPEYIPACDFNTYADLSADAKYYVQVEASPTTYQFFEIKDLASELVFELLSTYEFGSVTFEIEYNAVKKLYKVDVFKETIIDSEIIKTVSNEGNNEVIFYDQLADNKIFVENAVAKIEMDPSVPSGSYYIKVYNAGANSDTAFIGFEYDSQVSKTIYVFLNQPFELEKKYDYKKVELTESEFKEGFYIINEKGEYVEATEFKAEQEYYKQVIKDHIIGIYANKTNTAEDLRDIGSTTLSLTKFISLYYKTIDAEGNIVRKALKNDIEKIYSASNALDVTTIFVADDKYYAVAENGAIKYLGSEEEYDALTPYVKGNYYTYDKKITDDIYASAFKQTVAEDTVVKSVAGTNFYESTTPNDKYYIEASDVAKVEYNSATLNEVSYNNLKFIAEEGTNNDSEKYVSKINQDEPNNGYACFEYGDFKYYYPFYGSKVVMQAINIEQTTTDSFTEEATTTVEKLADNLYKFEDGENIYYIISYVDITSEITIKDYNIYKANDITIASYNNQNVGDVVEDKYYIVDATIKEVKETTPKFKILQTEATPTGKYEYINKDDFGYDVESIVGEGVDLVKDKDGIYYVVSTGASVNVSYIKGGKEYTIYRPEKVFTDNINSNKEEKNEEINGVEYYTFTHEDKTYYVQASDVRTCSPDGGITVYYKGEVLSEIDIVDYDTVEFDKEKTINFIYGAGSIIVPFEFKYKIKIDLDVRNSINGVDPTTTVISANTRFEGDGYTYNYLELETNKSYYFNELFGVIKSSSGETISADDVFDNETKISIEVVDAEEAKEIKEVEELIRHSFIKEDDIKDNKDLIRLSYELMRTNNSVNGIVFNFKLIPMGADNNGDYVVVKYSYTKNQQADDDNDFVKYILIKILPDYVVSMADTKGNPVTTTNDGKTLSNAGNVIEISDFDAIGYMQPSITIGGTGTQLTVEYVYGYGKATETSLGNDQFTKIRYKDQGVEKETYVQTISLIEDENAKQATLPVEGVTAYNNVEIIVSTKENINSFVKVNSSNAIDSARDISTQLFTTKLVGTDMTEYLRLGNGTYFTGNSHELDKNEGGLSLDILKDICLGERNYTATLTDDFGYTIKVYFKLMASSNPVVSSEADKRFKEGDTFDVGSKFNVIDVTEYSFKNTFYYDAGVENENYNSFAPKTAIEENVEYYFKLLNGTYVAKKLLDENNLPSQDNSVFDIKKYFKYNYQPVYNPTGNPQTNKYYEFNETTGYSETTDTTVKDNKTYYAQSENLSQVTEEVTEEQKYQKNYIYYLPKYDKVKKPEGNPTDNEYYELIGLSYVKSSDDVVDNGKTYYVQNGYESAVATIVPKGTYVEVDSDQSVFAAGNGEYVIKYGYGYISEITAETTKGDQTAITLMNGIVLVFDNTMLVPNAEMISTTLTKPIKEIKGATEQDQLDKFVMIEGINAFGYANENIKVANENSGYFNSISDLDKITISSIEYYFNDEKIGESNRLDGNSAEAYLSSSSKYYKYNTKKWMGRDALQLYQIPVLPGWVYGANDYADIEMRINLQFKDLVKALTIEEGKKYFVLEELKQNPVISDFYEYNETEKGYVETADDTAVDNKQYYELLPVKDENMMNNPKEAKYYEEQEINGKIYKLTEDTTIVSGKNYYTFKQVKYPAALGYYEQNGDVYTKTSDSTFISGKVYYTKKEETQPEAENCYTEVVETYTLSCPITVDKEQPRIVEKETTNVSDNVEFTLESHIKKAEGSAFTYYDDTLAITLPPFGTLTVEVVAQKKAPLTNHDMELVNISEFKEGVTYYTKNAENSYIAESAYVAGTQYYIVKTYKGTQTISSIYDKMDSTYYLGLSQIVGHTLNPDYNITVAFSGYDTGKVTRSGNFGFYCSYACNGCASGNEGSLMYTEVTNPIGSPTDNEYYELVGLSYVKSSDDVVDSGKTYYLKKEPNFEIKEKLGKITKIEVDGGIRYIPTENIVEIRTENKVEYVLIRDTNYVTELSPSESQKVVMLDLELKTISSDLLHLADMGALDSAGKQLITKYYVAVSSDGEYYQIVKKYNVYPSLFGFSTDDINHRVYAELDCNCVGDEKLNCKHNTFEFKTWSDEVNANYYGAENEVIGEFLKAKGEDVSQLYFELGDKDTTSASINKADGTITIDRDKYILDGTNFITINIYAKASGENGLYIDDNLSYSGNEYNEPVFTVYVYLKEANVAVS